MLFAFGGVEITVRGLIDSDKGYFRGRPLPLTRAFFPGRPGFRGSFSVKEYTKIPNS
jgi:hypothetical protein